MIWLAATMAVGGAAGFVIVWLNERHERRRWEKAWEEHGKRWGKSVDGQD